MTSDERTKRQEERRLLSEQKKQAQAKLTGRINSQESNPCYQEYHLSFKCLSDNNYKEDVCDAFFQNYKTCKTFWSRVERDRRTKGIVPSLPSLAEREKIKAELFKKTYGS